LVSSERLKDYNDFYKILIRRRRAGKIASKKKMMGVVEI